MRNALALILGIATLVLPKPGPWVRAEERPAPRDWKKNPAIVEIDGVRDIYALGDVHSDYERLVTLLTAARIIAEDPASPDKVRWTAGKAVLVTTGDFIDKGDNALGVIALFRALQTEAEKAGGRVVVTLGNHEAEFLGIPDGKKTADFASELKARGLDPAAVAAGTDRQGVGAFLRGLPVAARIDDWFFVHAGNTHGLSLDKLRGALQSAIDRDGYKATILIDPNSLLEARLHPQPWWDKEGDTGEKSRKQLAEVVQSLGVKHLAIGHQPGKVQFADGTKRAPGELIQWGDGLIFLLDVGMSRRVGNSAGALLHIHRDKKTTTEVVYPDGKRKVLWAEAEPPPKPAAATPDEPRARELSLVRSGEFLDAVTLAWIKEKQCASCHTGFPYLAARQALGDAKAPALLEVRRYFEERVAAWDRGGKGAGMLKGDRVTWQSEGVTEVVAIAATLALHDAQTTGKLHPRTRQALDRIWELQQKDGSWKWNQTGLFPLESDAYFGAVYAAVGVGGAPEGYAQSDAAKEGLTRLKGYLQKNAPPNVHHRIWLLWASLKLDGLMTATERERTIKDLLALQRDDGGWCLPSLGDWKRRNGAANDRTGPSDGYATGLILYVLRQAGVSATEAPMRRGVEWLKTNQRASGRWFTHSLNWERGHSIANAGTAFAVLALKACEGAEK
jgi:squalene-hopene/tetraprenyl-beta-curcumene cyclase